MWNVENCLTEQKFEEICVDCKSDYEKKKLNMNGQVLSIKIPFYIYITLRKLCKERYHKRYFTT